MAKNQNKYLNLAVLASVMGMFGASFDAFWHLTRGRESFFLLPHVFVYGAILFSLYVSWQGYRTSGQIAWKWLFRILCTIPLLAAMDELWHRWKGIETIDSPSIVWSPPHILLFLAIMACLMILTTLITHTEKLKTKNLLGSITLGLFLNMLCIFLSPLLPIGPHQLLGISGIGVAAAAVLCVMLLARRLFPDIQSAGMVGLVFVALQLVIWDASYYIPNQYNFLHIPDWLFLLTYLIPAYFIDYTDEMNNLTRGTLAGALIGILFFGLGGLMIPDSMFTYAHLWTGALAAGIGGMLAGLAHEHTTPRNLE